ncbi:MAG: Gldg family protein, partial [bacterium]|nr:Gldg family protein [bacterium]
MYAILPMLLVTLGFALVVLISLIPLTIFCKAAYAVLRRNFAAYFTNPTGYVFLCLFVFLTSCAAFWPHEFFSTNLANLDQLNEWLPYIMLIFIPAITMSIWAEERSQGTDELLLTLPATDFDIVIGKYLAAALIYTVSLLFSQISTFLVLAMLSNGEVDVGLIFATYFGYWLMGLAMLAVGMVASFLTNNLTVGFILGALFNAQLALAGSADTIVSNASFSRFLASWSLLEQFQNFGRGVFSISSFAYFAMIIVIGVYLSVVLVVRRHWVGCRDGKGMLIHYLVRTISLVMIMIGLTWLFSNNDFLWYDATAGSTNSLHVDSQNIIKKLDSRQPVIIDAYISAEVPQEYAQTRYELVSLLNRFKSLSGGKLQVNIYDDLLPFGDIANQARERYGIEPQMVATESQGKTSQVEVILGAAFRSGLEKVVVPFFDYGIPVEYELVRSISTVATGQRDTIGILRTDAQLFGG